MKPRRLGMTADMPYAVMTSAFREAERLHAEDRERFNQIVTEATVAEPELAAREPLSLVAFWVYDQRVNSGALDEDQSDARPDMPASIASGGGMAPGRPGTPAADEAAGAEVGAQEASKDPAP